MSGSTDSGGSATRDPSQTPFASDSVFNLPLGSNATWQSNDQLSNASVFVNTTTSGFTQNIYTGTDSDPLVTVTNNAGSGGTAGTFRVHIPANAVPSSGSDSTLAVDDTTSGTWYSFGGFNWTGNNTASISQGSGESDTGSGIDQSGSNYDEAVGTLRESDLQAGTIDHMLRIQLPTGMLMSFSNSVSNLAPYAWPQTQEDGFAINGKGGTPYSGTVPFGVTIGIPADATEPGAVKGNAGADMLWHALQNHGAMIRDSAGSGNTVTLQADQNVDESDPLVRGMDQFGSQIMAAARILTNQGPDSINGGGTPIVALDPPVAGGSATSTPKPTASNAAGSGSTSDNGSGAADSTNGASTTITSAALSSGQSSTGGASGMTFVASPDSTGTSSGTSGGTSTGDPGAASSGATGTSAVTAATSSSDFTVPSSASVSSSDGQAQSGTSQSAWWINHHAQEGFVAHHG
jgi:hypothetical protein